MSNAHPKLNTQPPHSDDEEEDDISEGESGVQQEHSTAVTKHSSASSLKENITVGVRVRSFTASEPRSLAIRMAGGTCQVTSEDRGSQRFTFDHCFWSNDVADDGIPYASQRDVYDAIGAPLVERCSNGFNCCLIAYGPTGSGKTYSLFGPSTPTDGDDVVGGGSSAESEGIIPRVMRQLFASLKERLQFAACSVVEIYLEDVYDLLQDGRQELHVRPDLAKKTFYVAGATETAVSTFEDVLSILREAARRKTVEATAKNAHSSRAHTIVQVKLTLKDPDHTVRLAFADLAGSERIKETQSEGITREQAKHINLSLMSLGKCVEATARLGRDGASASTAADILHFKDSTLTKVLKEYIAGNTLTTLLVTVAPGAKDFYHTMHALRFGDRAKHITHHASIQTTLAEAIVAPNMLHDVGQVAVGDMGIAEGGRLYLFRHTKEYTTAQFSIRMLSMQKREQHLRTSYGVEEQQAFQSLLRYFRREASRVRAHAAKMELKKLPVLMRLRRAMAITEHAEPSHSAPPVLNQQEPRKSSRLPPVPRFGRSSTDTSSLPKRALSQEPQRSSSSHIPELPEIPPSGRPRFVRKVHVASEPTGPAQPSLRFVKATDDSAHPQKGSLTQSVEGKRRSRSAEDRLLSPHPPSSPSRASPSSVSPTSTRNKHRHAVSPRKINKSTNNHNAAAERQFTSSEYMQRLLIETEESTSWKKMIRDVTSSIPEHGSVAKHEAEESRKSSRALLSRRGSSVVSPVPRPQSSSTSPTSQPTPPPSAGDPIERHDSGLSDTGSNNITSTSRSSSTTTPLRERDATATRPARQKSAKRTRGAPGAGGQSSSPSVATPSPSSKTSGKKNVVTLQAERQFMANEYMQRVIIETDERTSWKKFGQQVESSIPAHGVSTRSATEEARKSSRALMSRRRSSAVSPMPHRESSTSPSTPTSNSRSPSFMEVAPAAVLVSNDAVSPTTTDGSRNSNEEDASWFMGRATGSQVHRVQSGVKPSSRAGATVFAASPSPPVQPKPTQGTRPPVAALSPSLITEPPVASLEELVRFEDVRRRDRVQQAEQTAYKIIVVKIAVDAATLLVKLPPALVKQNQGAFKQSRAALSALFVKESKSLAEHPEFKRHSMWLSGDSHISGDVHTCSSVSWSWLMMFVEYASCVMLWCLEEEGARALHEEHRTLSAARLGRKGKAASSQNGTTGPLVEHMQLLSNVLSSLRSNCATLQHEIHRGLVLLRDNCMSPDNALEASLDRNEMECNGILLPSGSSATFARRGSMGDGSSNRLRQRKVSFSEGTENHLHHNTDRDIVEEEEEVTQTVPPAQQERAISPISSTPPSSPRSTPSSTPPRSPLGASLNSSSLGQDASLNTTASPNDLQAYSDPHTHPEYATPPLPPGATFSSTYHLLSDIRRIDDCKASITRQNSRGTFTEEEQLRVTQDEDVIGSIKREMIAGMSSIGTEVVLIGEDENDQDDDEAVTALHDFFGDLIFSTDIDRLNLRLVNTLIDVWRQGRLVVSAKASGGSKVNLIDVTESRGLIPAACTDGSIGYLKSLLNLYRVDAQDNAAYAGNLDFGEISSSAMFNQLHRIPLVHTLLTYSILHSGLYPTLHQVFVDAAQELKHEWNEFLSDICSSKKLLAKESKELRLGLVTTMLRTPYTVIPLDMLDEGADDNTRLSRIVKDGDLPLLEVFVECLPAAVLRELMLHINPDNTTVLIQAVIGGHQQTVARLCHIFRDYASSGDRDEVRKVAQLRCEEGSALELCILLGRGEGIQVAIEALLQEVG